MHESYDYGLWTMVLINILIFVGFVFGLLKPKRKYEWRTLGIFTAFIVALFTEMYGFPLTIYVLISFLGSPTGTVDPFQHVNGHLLGTIFGAAEWIQYLICLFGGLVMGLGLLLMSNGWKKIHNAKGNIVIDGIYSKIRHPQYSGLFLITIGMLIQWPTIITLAMWPVLMFSYYRLAMREEKVVEDQFGEAYMQYKEKVPAFIPRFQRFGIHRSFNKEKVREFNPDPNNQSIK